MHLIGGILQASHLKDINIHEIPVEKLSDQPWYTQDLLQSLVIGIKLATSLRHILK